MEGVLDLEGVFYGDGGEDVGKVFGDGGGDGVLARDDGRKGYCPWSSVGLWTFGCPCMRGVTSLVG